MQIPAHIRRGALALALWPWLASAATPWPPDIGGLGPDVSLSPSAADFASPPEFVAPGPEVPPERARWAGLWKGWACAERACDTKLAVLSVSGEGARVIYLFASRQAKPNPMVRDAVFVDNELQIAFPSGLRVAYRMRPDGNVEMYGAAANGFSFWGVLQKAR